MCLSPLERACKGAEIGQKELSSSTACIFDPSWGTALTHLGVFLEDYRAGAGTLALLK